MTDPRPTQSVVGWEFTDPETMNVIGWTEEREFFDEWMAEVKAGDWGDVVVRSVDADGIAVEHLWPDGNVFVSHRKQGEDR